MGVAVSSKFLHVENICTRMCEVEKLLRLKRGEISKKTGYSASMVSAIMNGIREPQDRFIQLFCSAYAVSENWLRTGEGEMFLKPPPEVTNLQYVLPPQPGETSEENEKIVYAALKRLHGWDMEEVIKGLTALPRSARMKILAQMFEAIEEEDERKKRFNES